MRTPSGAATGRDRPIQVRITGTIHEAEVTDADLIQKLEMPQRLRLAGRVRHRLVATQ